MPAGRPKDSDREARDGYEDGILASLVDIPYALRFLRIRIRQCRLRYPETGKLLDDAEAELDNIEQRTEEAKRTASKYHGDKWG